jgi:hypothetical protein
MHTEYLQVKGRKPDKTGDRERQKDGGRKEVAKKEIKGEMRETQK